MNLALTWAEGQMLNSPCVKAWANSLNEVHATDTRVVVLSPQAVKIPGAQNIVMKPPGTCPAHRRWFAYNDIIRSEPDCQRVLVADCRDLIFQADPFAILKDSTASIIVANEQQRTGEHQWCINKARAFATLIGYHAPDPNRMEINGGIQLGTRDGMILLAAVMESFLHSRRDNIDQAFINWWIYNRCPVQWKFAPESWYIHGESVKLGRQKIEIREGLAYVKPATSPAAVWHQYDRTGHDPIIIERLCPPPPIPELKDSRILFLVAHYNEPLKWLNSFPYRHLVITKNGSDRPDAIVRPNIGFEAETWAWFFAERYDDLPEIIVCLQGDPFDHVRIEAFRQILKRIETEKSFSYIPISTPGHKGLTGTDTPDHRGIPMRDWWTRLFKSSPPLSWYAPYGAQFAVHRDAVRARPREYWEMIRDNCKTREDACTLERLWQFILMGLP